MSLESVLARIEAIKSRIDSSPVSSAAQVSYPQSGMLKAAPANASFSALLAQRSSTATNAGTGAGLPAATPPSWQALERPPALAAATSGSATSGSASVDALAQGVAVPASPAGIDRPLRLRPSGALSDRDLRDVLAEAGFSGDALRMAWAIARRESGGRPGAVSRPNGDGTVDHGLFQVNDVHRGSWIDFDRLHDARYSAEVAFRMSDGGRNFSAWGLGDTGWAGHLQRTAPQRHQQLAEAFQRHYQDYPFA